MRNARLIAAEVLRRSRDREGFAAELIDSEFLAEAGYRARDGQGVSEFASSDRRLVTALVMGVIRRRATLDALIAPFLTRPFRDLHPDTLDTLRIGAFQLAFLTHVPIHAAVNETVDVLPTNRGSVRNFVNAVLRRLVELLTDDDAHGPAVDALPMEAGHFRQLTRPVFPHPGEFPAAYLAAAFSWPRWLAERWLERFDFDECIRLGFWFNTPPQLWLRVNKLQGERENYRVQLAAQQIDTIPGEHPQSLMLPEGAAIRELPGYDTGEFAVQDHSAMVVATALSPQPGNRVLDLCAAPGGKTTHLAELMRNRGSIVACDIEAKRLETVTSLCQRLGITIVETAVLVDGTDAPEGPFDCALVDVPCSNTGVLGRRPEVRWRLQPNEFEHLIRLQTKLLFTALERVKTNGVVLYSTCSIEPDENSGVVKGVLRGMRNVKLEAEAVSIPGRPSDGGYWARLRKGAPS